MVSVLSETLCRDTSAITSNVVAYHTRDVAASFVDQRIEALETKGMAETLKMTGAVESEETLSVVNAPVVLVAELPEASLDTTT